jgi:hypothetical protein
VGRGVDHPLGQHDLAGEPAKLVGVAEPFRGRGYVSDGGLVAVGLCSGEGGDWSADGGDSRELARLRALAGRTGFGGRSRGGADGQRWRRACRAGGRRGSCHGWL